MQRHVSVHPLCHQRLVELLDEPVEYGGTLALNEPQNSLELSFFRKGNAYDEISIPPGFIQWHTHPRKCSPTRCTLAIPSSHDLVAFINTAIQNDTRAHLVYSADGVYAIILDPHIAAQMKRNASFKQIFTTQSQQRFNAMTQQYMADRPNYSEFRDKWLDTVNKSGFRVRLYPLSSRPAFRVNATIDTHW